MLIASRNTVQAPDHCLTTGTCPTCVICNANAPGGVRVRTTIVGRIRVIRWWRRSSPSGTLTPRAHYELPNRANLVCMRERARPSGQTPPPNEPHLRTRTLPGTSCAPTAPPHQGARRPSKQTDISTTLIRGDGGWDKNRSHAGCLLPGQPARSCGSVGMAYSRYAGDIAKRDTDC